MRKNYIKPELYAINATGHALLEGSYEDPIVDAKQNTFTDFEEDEEPQSDVPQAVGGGYKPGRLWSD